MANTYTQIYIQAVFAVEGRQNLVRLEWKEELHKYITGIVTAQGQKLLAIHCMPDHTQLLIGQKPNIALSDLVGEIKTGSTNFINRKRWVMGRFSWPEGFGAFSYSHSQLTPSFAIFKIKNVITRARRFVTSIWPCSRNSRCRMRSVTLSNRLTAIDGKGISCRPYGA